MRALVTGGAGFIGSHLVEELLANGWDVVVLDNLSTGLEENVPSAVELVIGEAHDSAILNRITPGCNAIFHLAAVSSVQESLNKPFEVHDTNLTMTLKLLEAANCHSVRRFVFSSSAAVYGDTGGQPAREDMNPRPMSHYAVQKLASEYYCDVYRRLYGLEAVCLRYFNVFGPRQRFDSPYSGVIARFMHAGLQREPMTVYGDGLQSRDFCYVKDVVAANVAAVEASLSPESNLLFNVGRGVSTSLLDLAKLIAQISNHDLRVSHHPQRTGEIRHSKADTTNAKKLLNFAVGYDLASGLKPTWDWFSCGNSVSANLQGAEKASA
jgi:nucleoside-diphosphate-sugar epimerase